MEAVTMSIVEGRVGTTESNNVCSGKHKTRLFVKQDNFSFTEAFIRKHDDRAHHNGVASLGRSIVATDWLELGKTKDCAQCVVKNITLGQPKETLFCDQCEQVKHRIEQLKEKGVTVIFGVHETKVHEQFAGKKFERIHWNCPDDDSGYRDETLPLRIADFFRSCRLIQNAGDRVHITLTQPDEPEKFNKNFYQAVIYNIVRAVSGAGYVLIKKRRFDTSRYPQYEVPDVDVKKIGMREFVFQKVDEQVFQKLIGELKDNKERIPISVLTERLKEFSPKNFQVVLGEFRIKKREPSQSRVTLECSTDDDSSDGEAITT